MRVLSLISDYNYILEIVSVPNNAISYLKKSANKFIPTKTKSVQNEVHILGFIHTLFQSAFNILVKMLM